MSAAHRVGRKVRLRLLQDSRKGRLPLLPLSGTRSAHIALKQGPSPKLYANYTETSLLGFAPPVLCRRSRRVRSNQNRLLKGDSHEKDEKSMCTRSVVRFPACLSVRRPGQQTQG